MSLTGLVNLVDGLLNPTAAQALTQAAPAQAQTAQTPPTATNIISPNATQDQFIPSTQSALAQATAEAAGLFTVNQFSLLTRAVDSVLAQSATAQSGPAQSGPAQTPPASTAARSVSLAAANVEAQLQRLNSALAALGLKQTDIQQIDRIAGLINDFQPTAFTNLIAQLELAQNTTPATATTPAHTAANAGNAFQLQGLQVQLTLANNNGQTIQVQAPVQPDVNSPNGDARPSLTKAARA